MAPTVARWVILVAVMTGAPTALAHAQQEHARTRILMVYAHDPNAPGAVLFERQLKAVVRDRIPTGLEIYDECLDLDRFRDPQRSAQLAGYFREKYQGFRPDAIVIEGAQALRFARDRLVDRSAGGAMFTLTLPADEKGSGS